MEALAILLFSLWFLFGALAYIFVTVVASKDPPLWKRIALAVILGPGSFLIFLMEVLIILWGKMVIFLMDNLS